MSRRFNGLQKLNICLGFVLCPDEDASGFCAGWRSSLGHHRLWHDTQFLRLHHRLLGILYIVLVWHDDQMVAIAALS